MKKMNKKIVVCLIMVAVLVSLLSVTAFAAGTGDVAGAVEKTWNDAKGQIKQVTNNVIFPIVDLILAILLFVKLGTAYFDYIGRFFDFNRFGVSGYFGGVSGKKSAQATTCADLMAYILFKCAETVNMPEAFAVFIVPLYFSTQRSTFLSPYP